MKVCVGLIISILMAAPVFAQDSDETALREQRIAAAFADGNLALRFLERNDDPVQQLKRFFDQAKLPLTSVQEKQLSTLVDAQVQVLRNTQGEDEIRKVNQEFTKKSNAVLTVDQRTELRRYRTEQIMLRGGFPALRVTLENAGTPLEPGQGKQVQALYDDLNRNVAAVPRDTNGNPDRVQLDQLERQALGSVLKMLTVEQRRALATSSQGTFISKVRP